MDDVKKVNLFGAAELAVVDYEKASDLVMNAARNKQGFSVFAMPVHSLTLCLNQGILAKPAANADLIVPDGHPVRWAMNFFHKTKLKDRVYGPELTRRVLEKANEEKFRVFLYGGKTQNTLTKFEAYILSNFPHITICGKYREKNFEEDTLQTSYLRQMSPDIILVGLGCPRQEIWIDKKKTEINCAFLGVGAAFSFYAGDLEQAPEWMQNNGLEWLFRLIKEPRRLYKRYFITNTKFLLRFLQEIVSEQVRKLASISHTRKKSSQI